MSGNALSVPVSSIAGNSVRARVQQIVSFVAGASGVGESGTPRTPVQRRRRTTMIARHLGVAAFAAVLAGCQGDQDALATLAPEGETIAHCNDFRASPKVLAAMRKADEQLRHALASGKKPDPVVMAKHAVERGDFRLAAATTPNGVAFDLYNTQCRILGEPSAWTIRALAFVPDLAVAEGKGADDPATAFGRGYNAALMADPHYPYRDICRPVADVGPEPAIKPDQPVAQPYGFPDLDNSAPVETLGYAARHSMVGQIKRLLREDPGALNRPDMFGLTPLAWAIAYQRWRSADALIAAGASPTGAVCQSAIDRQSPLQVARLMRWSDMIRRLQPLVSEDDFAKLRQNPRYDDATLADFNRAFAEIRSRYDPILRKRPFSRHELHFDIDADGNSTSCEMEPASNSPEFDGELCEVAMKLVRWTPARDAFATTVAGNAKLVFGIGK